MSAGERIDWGGDTSPVRGGKSSSFSSLLGRNKSPKSNKNNNKYTGFTVNKGGSASQKTAAGLSGLKKTLVNRRVNTAKNKNSQITKGGGGTSIANIQSKPQSVRVRPEQ